MNTGRTLRRRGLLLLASGALLALSGCSGGDPIVAPAAAPPERTERVRPTESGAVRGLAWDEDTHAWLGVPYARPPVGALRWKAPRDPEPWDGVRDAVDFCRPCSQLGGFLGGLDPSTFGKPIGTEDCLYLNVWRPRAEEGPLPVFVYIHGGMNSVGEAATSLYHGARLSARAQAVVVTLNYRLGPLGFFHHGSLDTGDPLDDSGAYGLMDIIHALGWVRDNIAAFGGDPGNVTIGGESAGAFNVCSLMGSPPAAGLFHRAVALSPSGTLATNTMEDAEASSGDMLVELVLADPDLAADTEASARRLIEDRGAGWAASYWRSRTPAQLLNAAVRFSSMGLNEMGLLVQENRLADGAVIPEDFAERFERGGYNRVPLLIGSNAEEYKMFLFTGILPPLLVQKDETELCEILRTTDPEDPGLTEADFIAPGDHDLYELAGTLLGGIMFDASIHNMVSRVLPHQDVYRYAFAWNEQPAPAGFLLGAGHMTALPFFFGNFQTDPASLFRISWTEGNRAGREALSETMMHYWGNFFRSGDPGSGPFPVPAWAPCSAEGGCPPPIRLDAPASGG